MNSEQWQNKALGIREKLIKMLNCELPIEASNVEFFDSTCSVEPAVDEAVKRWPHLNNLRVPDSKEYTKQDVLINGAVSGTMRTPAKHNGMAVLCLHGHARGAMLGREMCEYCAVPLAEQGFVSLAVDLMGFGHRRNREFDQIELDFGGQTLFLQERVIFSQLLSQGKTFIGAQLEELSACVSFLKSIEGIDKIAVMGHSMGGIYSFWLGALDERVDVTACLAGMICYETFAESDNSRYHGVYCLVPGIVGKLDSGDILSLIAPRVFYGLHGRNDAGFPAARVLANSEKARGIYRKMNVEDRFRSETIEGDHGDMLSESYLETVFKFLKSFI